MAGLMDITSDVSKRFGVSKAEARKLVEFVCDDIVGYLGDNQTVNIRGFGVFSSKDMGERTIRNPRTREPSVVKPSVRVLFTPATRIKTELRFKHGLLTEAEYKELTKKDAAEETESTEIATEQASAETKADAKADQKAAEMKTEAKAKPAAKPAAAPAKPAAK